ncbi:hypothetical protein EMIT0194MI4_40397 [Pseudomonas sp. IT-194MI4]
MAMNDLWRGSLLPLGCEAAPNVPGPNRVVWIYDCFAAEREQAPSPQKPADTAAPSTTK